MKEKAISLADFAKSFEAIERTYPVFRNIGSLEAVLAAMMTMLDSWAADHDVPDEEVTALLEESIRIRGVVFKEIGRSPKSTDLEVQA